MGKAIEPSQWLSLVASFALVLVLLLGTLWVLRRIGAAGLRPQTGRRLAVVESLWLGNRQRVVLLRVDGREILLGISAQGINRLDSQAGTGVSGSAIPAQTEAELSGELSGARGRFLDAMRSISGKSSGEGR